MRLLPVLALPALALVALSGCAMVPAGPIVSQSRDIDAATSVVLNTWGDLTIREGEPTPLEQRRPRRRTDAES